MRGYAFGETRTSSGSTTNPFRFVGQLGYYDDPSTPFQYLRARYYAPGYGTFSSVDPYGPLLPPYLYARNRATAAVDPSGLQGTLAHCQALLAQANSALLWGDCTAANKLLWDLYWQCGRFDPIFYDIYLTLNKQRLAKCGGPRLCPAAGPAPGAPGLEPAPWTGPTIQPLPPHKCKVTSAVEVVGHMGGWCSCEWECCGRVEEGDVPMAPKADCWSACEHYAPWCKK